MGIKMICGGVLVLAAACGGKKTEDGGGGGGTVVGSLTPQEHKSADGTLTVKGPMPAAWKPREVMNKSEFAIAQSPGEGAPAGQITIGLKAYMAADATPQSSAKQAETDAASGGYDIVTPTAEIAAGRWGYLGKIKGVQYRPGIDMFEGAVIWQAGTGQYARCYVRWTGKNGIGALDLCKALEVTAAPQ